MPASDVAKVLGQSRPLKVVSHTALVSRLGASGGMAAAPVMADMRQTVRRQMYFRVVEYVVFMSQSYIFLEDKVKVLHEKCR